MMKRLVVLLCLASSAFSAKAAEEIDYVNLGATLLKDGYIQRAKSVLEKVDVKQPGFDFARYYSLKGVLLHKRSYPRLSNIFLEESMLRGQSNPAILLYVARNHWQLQNYAEVVKALDRAGEAARENEQMMVIKAEAYKQQGLMAEAWAVLDEGIELFPESSGFYKQKFYYLMELGFYQQAEAYVHKYLKARDYSPRDYLTIAYALRENNQLSEAAALLEEGVIKHPDDDKLVELLGQVYIDGENYLMAALVFDWASIEHPRFAIRAATLYLKAKQPIRSLQLNRRVSDQTAKFRQRLGIDIFLDDYETLVTKTAALKRYDLLADDNIVYALGYGYFRIGDYENARAYLKQIKDSQLFAKASVVFKQIEKCQDDPVECY